jgi:hypothetical protein
MIKLIEENNITDYFQNVIREGSENLLEMKANPYLLRKERYKEFIKRKYPPK